MAGCAVRLSPTFILSTNTPPPGDGKLMNAPQQAARSTHTPTGQIFDLGYQAYSGPRQGRTRARIALYTAAVKSAFGIGRGAKAKVLPFSLLALAIIPAAVALGIATLLSTAFSPIRYSNYLNTTSLILTLFCAVVAPELLCSDRRQRVLSLYFAHALTRFDYVVMKALALLTALLAITLAPQALLFLGNMLAAADAGQYARDNLKMIPRILGSGVLMAFFLAMLSLAAASLTPRRIFAAGGFLLLFLISTATANAIWETFRTDAWRPVMLLSLGDLPFAVTTWIFREPYDANSLAGLTNLPGVLLFTAVLAWAVAALGVVIWRYARWEP